MSGLERVNLKGFNADYEWKLNKINQTALVAGETVACNF